MGHVSVRVETSPVIEDFHRIWVYRGGKRVLCCIHCSTDEMQEIVDGLGNALGKVRMKGIQGELPLGREAC
jgi:hypothetical protein